MSNNIINIYNKSVMRQDVVLYSCMKSMAYFNLIWHNTSMQIPKNGRDMISFIVILSSTYLVICFLLFFIQRQMIYFPTREVSATSTDEIILDTGEVRLKVWVLNPGKQKALIYFGGNAENVAYNIDDFKTLFSERTVYLINYRGYGGSSGSPHEDGFYSDALFAYDHFLKHHSSITAMGRSIGAAVATYLASKRDIEKLILITPFDSAVSVAKHIYGFFPMSLIIQEKLDSADRAGKITAETLIIAATEDKIIPYKNTDKLAKAFKKKQIQVAWLSEVGHNTVHLHPDYRKIIKEFMR